MNVKRGLFRSWIVVSLLWVSVIGAYGLDSIAKDKWWAGNEWSEDPPLDFLPVRCDEVRGQAETDYKRNEAFEPWNRYRGTGVACFYTLERFHSL